MTYTRIMPVSSRLPLEPAVLSVDLVVPTGGTAGDVPVYIPWSQPCKLQYAYVVTTVAEGNKGTVEIDLELNTASGTEIMSIQVAQNAAIGDIDEATTWTDEDAAKNLSADNADRDIVNVEVDGTATSTWQGTLFMYFEPYYGG
jgi:hypothetical protein